MNFAKLRQKRTFVRKFFANCMESKSEFKIVFMGTPEFATASLAKIHNAGYHIAAVVTAPDKPAGRGKVLTQSDVKRYALSVNLPVLQPINLKNETFLAELKSLEADLFVVVAFRMLPESVWAMPPRGSINLHGSLLPKYRGAAPINHAVIAGETETGVTTFFISQEIDTGNLIAQAKTPILPSDNAGTIHDKLMLQGADLLLETIDSIRTETCKTIPQDNALVCHAPKIFKDNSRINWTDKCEKIHNFVRGLSPVPTAWTQLQHTPTGKISTLKIFETEYELRKTEEIGTIIAEQKQIGITCADGIVFLKNLRPEGKKSMTAKEFLNGYKPFEYQIVNI